jgi:hypothetical protein
VGVVEDWEGWDVSSSRGEETLGWGLIARGQGFHVVSH